MSRLDELIAKLCPNGVEYKKLSDVLDYKQPYNYIVKSTNYDSSYQTPVLTAGQTFILGYTNDTAGIFNASQEIPVILFDDFTTASKWVDFPFKVKSSACKILIQKDSVSMRYVYYAMQHILFDSTQHKRYWISEYSNNAINVYDAIEESKIVEELDDISNMIIKKKNVLGELDNLIKSRFISQGVVAC